MRRFLALATLVAAPDLLAQQGPPADPFVAGPRTGSKHNRGCAVDLTMYDQRIWWHFNYKDWREYPLLDIPFSAIAVK